MKPKSLFTLRLTTRANAVKLVLASAAAPFLLSYTAHAASDTWKSGATSATWATAGNWTAGNIPGTGDTATFNNAGGATDVISLGTGVTIKTIAFSGTPDAYTIGSGAVGSQTLTFDDSATITLANTITTNQLINAKITLGSGLTITNSDTTETLTIAGVISGGGTLGKAGGGNVILSGANTFTGTTTLTAGTLTLNNNLALQNSLVSVGSSGGTIALGAGITAPTLGGLTGSRNLSSVISAGYTGIATLTLNNQGTASSTYSGNITEGATGMNLIKSGTGTQVLSGTNSYTGTTTVNAGLLAAAKLVNLPGYNVSGKVIINGGTLGVTIGGTGGWSTGDVDTLLSNATKTSGALGIDTSNGDVVQWTDITTTNFGSLGLTKLGGNTLTLDQTATFTGTTTLSGGTLKFTQDASLAALTFGVAASDANLSTLDLTSANATFSGAMLIRTNSSGNNAITIGSGKKLTNNGNVNWGNATSSTTNLVVSGQGGWDIITNGGTFGGVGGSGNISTTVDMSGLPDFNVDLRTTGSSDSGGTFRAGLTTGNTTSRNNSVKLAVTSKIVADEVLIEQGGQIGTASLILGSGTQIINTDNIKMSTGSRDSSSLSFNTSTGTLKIRGTDGDDSTRSNLTMSTVTSTGGGASSNFNVTGHEANMLFDAVAIGKHSGNLTGPVNATFSFDQGDSTASTVDLDANSVAIGTKSGGNMGGTTSLSATMNIGGTANLTNTSDLGVVTMGIVSTSGTIGTSSALNSTLNIKGSSTTVAMDSISMANYTGTVGLAVNSNVNISGGNATITGGINMAAGDKTGITSNLTITGGSLSVGTGGIYRDTSVAATTTLQLNDGSLNLNGNAIGGSGANAITTQFESGTLSNVGEINAGATGLTKTTAGTLTLSGTNTYTGDTFVSAGTLLINGALGNTAVTVGTTATIGGTGTIAGSLNFDAGAKLDILNIGDALAITGSVTFDGFGFSNITGWDYMNASIGTYTLLAGSDFNLANVSNVGAGNALAINGGLSAYFKNGSLQVVVIPEPRAALLGGLGMLMLLRRRRA